MAKNFPKLRNKTDIQVLEVQRVLNEMNPKRTTQRYLMLNHFMIQMVQVNDKGIILKTAMKNSLSHRREAP